MRFKDLFHLVHDLFVGGTARFSRRWFTIRTRSQYKVLNQPNSRSSATQKIDWHLFTASALVVSAILWLSILPVMLLIPPYGSQQSQMEEQHYTRYYSSKTIKEKKVRSLPVDNWEKRLKHKMRKANTRKQTTLSPRHPLWSTLNAPPTPVNLNQLKRQIGTQQIARATGLEGKVTVEVFVDHKGNYLDHEITKSTHELLSAAVETKVRKLIFTPGIQHGYSAPMAAEVIFEFEK